MHRLDVQSSLVQKVVMNERGESSIRPFFIEDSILAWIHEDEKNNVNLPTVNFNSSPLKSYKAVVQVVHHNCSMLDND